MKRILFWFAVPCVLFFAIRGTGETWWKVYFTSPGSVNAANTPKAGIIQAIQNSKKTFYGAFFEISSPEIIDALVAAKKRNVDVRLVTDGDYFNSAGVERLMRVQIPVVPDQNKAFMHNKFAVIDGSGVWTGSFNLTENCSLRNNNNAILINSHELAQIYHAEFMEMFQDKIFGNRKDEKPFADAEKRYHVKIGDTDINAYFSPEDKIERIIVHRLQKAKKSVHFMAFSFTSDKIAEMMIAKHKEGVPIYGIFEKKGSDDKYSQYVKMKIEGLPVKIDNNKFFMHHKVIIIDEVRVITGSYNFSKSANKKNDENILIIDNKDIAADYLKEFYRLYK